MRYREIINVSWIDGENYVVTNLVIPYDEDDLPRLRDYVRRYAADFGMELLIRPSAGRAEIQCPSPGVAETLREGWYRARRGLRR